MSFSVKFDEAKVIGDMNAAAVAALRECGKDLLEKSQKLCPKDRGFNGGLVSTSEVEVDEETLTMRVRYKAPHAHLQHERVQDKHKNGEQAKFIEAPLNQNAHAYLRKVADAMGGRVRR
ncbi:MAG: hypothetical protein M1133_16385 [Armatimonadetes bacterium]|nr:hypothetical protein [Armatimonadota bacterium]